ncbi:hypothetical protein OG599_31895 [Streptomyces sp. NBC_01335]|uniref:hypothetical protein n=1 Tax=Streptomyces sp. NBC_01335 TaxID=2903828 RepID=UPI002E1421CC|nr:hypothetical protein OG599_31895 [Streptomyces sp. NBC_01335]
MGSQPVRTGQSVLAFVAAAAAIPALAIGLPTGLAATFLLTALPVAVPLMLRNDPRPFAWASLVVGSGLLAWAVVGVLLGMFLFVPTALMLLAAAFLDADTRPGALWLIAVVGAPAVGGLLLCGTYG